MFCLSNWFWVDPLGGKLTKQSVPRCYTEMTKDNDIFRCHPSYRSDLSWNDWILIDWGGGYETYLPAKLILFVDISSCEVVPEEQTSHEMLTPIPNMIDMYPGFDAETHNLSSSYLSHCCHWAVVQSCNDDGYMDNRDLPSEYFLKTKLAKRFKVETDKYRIIPITHIVGKAMCFANHIMTKVNDEFDETIVTIDHPSTWEEHFVNFGK